jgi:polyisoprenoid-binding protein YceI
MDHPLSRFRPGQALVPLALLALLASCSPPATAPSTSSVSDSPAVAKTQAPSAAAASVDMMSERTFRIDPERSKASWEAQETWGFWTAPTKAVGSTKEVQGEFALSLGESPKLAANHFTVDVSTLTSEPGETPRDPANGAFNPLDALPSRDGVVRGRLEAETHPMAEFTAARLDGPATPFIEGQEAVAQVHGDLTLRGVSRPVTFDTRAVLRGDILAGTAVAHFNLTDFGIRPPDLAAVKVQDGVAVVVEFTAAP